MNANYLRILCHTVNVLLVIAPSVPFPWFGRVLAVLSAIGTELQHARSERVRRAKPASKPPHNRNHHPHKR